MPTIPRLTAGLALLAALTCAASCATSPAVHQSFPPTADLALPPEPQLDADALASDKAADAYEAAYHAWAEGLKLQIGRLCRWSAANGAPGLDCPRP